MIEQINLIFHDAIERVDRKNLEETIHGSSIEIESITLEQNQTEESKVDKNDNHVSVTRGLELPGMSRHASNFCLNASNFASHSRHSSRHTLKPWYYPC